MRREVKALGAEREREANEALELFHFAYREFTRGPDRILEGKGLQRVHHRILYFVGRNPGIPVNGLLAILGVSKQALNAPLRLLLEMGLVDSRASSGDRRVRELRLSPDGIRLEATLSGLQRARMLEVFREAGPRAEEDWRAIMARIAQGASAP